MSPRLVARKEKGLWARGEKLPDCCRQKHPARSKCAASPKTDTIIKQRTCLYHTQRIRLPLKKVSLEILSCVQWVCTVKQSGEQIQMFMFLHFFRMSLKSGPFLSQVFSSSPSAVVGEGPAWGTRRWRRPSGCSTEPQHSQRNSGKNAFLVWSDLTCFALPNSV